MQVASRLKIKPDDGSVIDLEGLEFRRINFIVRLSVRIMILVTRPKNEH